MQVQERNLWETDDSKGGVESVESLQSDKACFKIGSRSAVILGASIHFLHGTTFLLARETDAESMSGIRLLN